MIVLASIAMLLIVTTLLTNIRVNFALVLSSQEA
jgi:hypothetical protein